MLLITQLAGQQGLLKFHLKTNVPKANRAMQSATEQSATRTILELRTFLIIWLFKPYKDYLTYLGVFD